METRQITQVRVYVLILNTFGAAESGDIVAVSDDYRRLVSWYQSQFADEPYREDGWYKTFKKGSTIEYNNPCGSVELNDTNHWNHGIHDEWVLLDDLDIIRNMYLYV